MKITKLSALSFFTAALVLSGCGEKKPGTTSSNPLTAPVEYLDAAAKAKISAEKTLDTTGVNQAIQMFSTQEGRYPTDLKELVSKGYLRQLPTPPFGMKIVYEVEKGEIKVVKQ